jgi:cyclopropane fatty-acyl-phospholipid synthase-like methyltransferase
VKHVEAPIDYVERYYEADLAEWDAPESRFYLSWLQKVKGRSVLSIGCGPNLYDDCRFFGELPSEVIGMDINRANIDFLTGSKNPNLKKARGFIKEKGIKVEALVGDVTKPNNDYMNRFDSIYGLGVFCAFEKAALGRVFSLFNSYLKPGGLLLDVDWTECMLSEKEKEKKKEYLFYNGDQGIREMGELMEKAGFSIVKHEVYDVPDKAAYGWGKIYGYLARKA